MKLKIKCPNCDEELIIEIHDEKVLSILIDNTFYTSKEEINKVLKENNIEFG